MAAALAAAVSVVGTPTAWAGGRDAFAPSGHPGPYVAPAIGQTSTTTAIPIDGTAPGRTFDGVGAISGGGGNSRLLIDYPEPQRSAILDYLFKPGYGASLQILKVEIGGDANSTDGSEASIEHSQGTVNCNAGYEWWLMEQAKARNPNIKLYALAWAAPGWLGSFFSPATIGYIVQWLTCAQQHGLTIDYLAGNQNEHSYQKTWTESLRAALDQAGFSSTQIVMSDDDDTANAWPIATDLAADPAFNAATAVVGEHDQCGGPTNGNECFSTATAEGLGKPLWTNELGNLDGATGAANMTRSEIRGYPNADLTGFITWPMMDAIPPGVPYENRGLIYADQPWSGYYQVNAMTYAIAMMSWFTAPGWQYIDGADGGFGGLIGASVYSNGSYATLKAPNGTDWSTLAETTTTTAEQYANFTISGGLSLGHDPRLAHEAELDQSGGLDGQAGGHPSGRRQVLLRPVARISVHLHHDHPQRQGLRQAAGPGHARLLQRQSLRQPSGRHTGVPGSNGRRLRIHAVCDRRYPNVYPADGASAAGLLAWPQGLSLRRDRR